MIRTINKAVAAVFITLALLVPHFAKANPIDDVIDQIYEMSLDEKDLNCLAKNIYYESRGEPKEGKVAVGMVTLNRADNPKYPNDICKVVNQRTRTQDGKMVCQFSWTCMRMRSPNASDPLWLESVKIAKNLMLGRYENWQQKYDNVHHFHSTSVNPGWNLRRVARVGRHIFYH